MKKTFKQNAAGLIIGYASMVAGIYGVAVYWVGL